MARPVTLFTGQWADLDFMTMCAKAKDFGYDGLELACWGDHFDVSRALQEEDYDRHAGENRSSRLQLRPTVVCVWDPRAAEWISMASVR